jgi:hypothetical protein
MSAAAASAEKTQVFLESDDEIRGQKYACLSFLTPSRGIIRNKELFFFSKFLEFYAMDYKIRSTESYIMNQLRDLQNQLSDIELAVVNANESDISGGSLQRQLGERISAMRGELTRKTGADMEAYVKTNIADFRESTIVEDYEKYMVVNRQRLDDEFHKANNFQTTVHGLKVRGVYSTNEQAVARAKALNKKDPYFNVYVADVGEWLPWDPEPDQIESQEYANEDLNKLMKAYRDNAAKRDAFFEEEKRQKMAAAAAEAMKRKEQLGATKHVEGGAGASPFESGVVDTGMFSGEGEADLAIARRKETASQ